MYLDTAQVMQTVSGSPSLQGNVFIMKINQEFLRQNNTSMNLQVSYKYQNETLVGVTLTSNKTMYTVSENYKSSKVLITDSFMSSHSLYSLNTHIL